MKSGSLGALLRPILNVSFTHFGCVEGCSDGVDEISLDIILNHQSVEHAFPSVCYRELRRPPQSA
jgi:hypothetical protein